MFACNYFFCLSIFLCGVFWVLCMCLSTCASPRCLCCFYVFVCIVCVLVWCKFLCDFLCVASVFCVGVCVYVFVFMVIWCVFVD